MNRFSLLAACFVAVTVAGCRQEQTSVVDKGLNDAELKFERARLVLAERPADAKTPTEAKDANETSDLVLIGRIEAGDIDPFRPGKAAFMMSEMPEEGHADTDEDHLSTCKFCQRRLKNAPKVVVLFNDADGQILDLDAKELFGVQKGDAVVVKGNGSHNEATRTITLSADGLFKIPSK